jgi:hypothetical protein
LALHLALVLANPALSCFPPSFGPATLDKAIRPTSQCMSRRRLRPMAQWPDCRTSVCGRCNTGLQLRVDPAFFCRSDHSDETMEIAILQKLGLAASSIAGCSVVCNVRKVDRSPEFRAQRGTFAPSLFLPGPGCTPGRSHASIPVPVHLFCHNSCLTGIITLHLLLAWCGRPSCCRRGGFGSELSPPLSSSPSEPTIHIRP